MEYRVICYKNGKEISKSGLMNFKKANHLASWLLQTGNFQYIHINDGKRNVSTYTTYHTIFNS